MGLCSSGNLNNNYNDYKRAPIIIQQIDLKDILILDFHVGHVGGEASKNILSIRLWAPVIAGEQHCLVISERIVASQE